TWRSLINGSMVDGGLTTTSNGSPALICFTKIGLKPEITLSLWPVVRSNSGPILSSTVAIALEVKTLISAASAAPPWVRIVKSKKVAAVPTNVMALANNRSRVVHIPMPSQEFLNMSHSPYVLEPNYRVYCHDSGSVLG